MVTLSREMHEPNACQLRLFTLSDIVTFVRELHPQNAISSILVIPSPIVTLSSKVELLNV